MANPEAPRKRNAVWKSAPHKIKVGLLTVAATAAAVGSVVGPHLDTSTGEFENWGGCSLGGSAKPGTDSELQNRLKNRFTLPSDDSFNGGVNFETMAAGKENAFKPDTSGDVEGYIVEVKKGGEESSNCGLTKAESTDAHIFISADPKVTDKKKCIIAEVTPRMREIMRRQGEDWSTTTLRKLMTGKKVRISGWLFYDKEHERNAENIKHHDSNWRASCWEIHPVTDIEVLSEPKPAPPKEKPAENETKPP